MSVILITGSSSGIGRAAALHFAAKGHTVYASMLELGPSADDLMAAADAQGVALHPVQLDVSDENSVRDAVADLLRREGQIDVLVNNAGIAPLGPLEELDDATVKSVFDTNVFGALRCIRAVLPTMRAQKSGTIVNVSSVAGQISTVCSGAYAGSKFALEGLSEALAQEVRPFGIHVALVEPGFIITPILGKALATLSTHAETAYPAAVRIATDLFNYGQQTGGPPEMVAETIEQAINDRSPRLRYPVGEPAVSILAARAGMSDEEWVELGRHETLDDYFGELMSHAPAPAATARSTTE
jgi:NAD(P)-dependent dehydrogenase (short-subunit alcohol dehydrogenase family)